MTDKDKLWNVGFAIEGNGWGQVKAKTFEEAEEKAKRGDFEGELEIDTWDINKAGHRGGYIEVDDIPEEIGE